MIWHPPSPELKLDIDPESWYSVREAAVALDVRPVRVRQLVTEGKFKYAQRVGRSLLIPGREILDYQQNRRPAGRPKGTTVYKLDVLGRRRKKKLGPRKKTTAVA